MMMAFFEKFPETRQREIVKDPVASVPVIARDDSDVPVETEEVRPKDVVAAACHSTVSQGVLSSVSMTCISWWQYPRISPEHLPLASLEGRRGRNYEFSLDPPARRSSRLLTPFWSRKGEVEDCPTDLRRVEVQKRVEDCPADLRIVEMLALTGYLLRLDLTEETLLDIMEKRLRLRRGGQDEVHQPLGGEPLTARIRASQLPVGWMTLDFSRFNGKGDPDQHLIEYRILIAPNDSDDQLARIFKQSLKGQVLLWYVRLRRNSINSFEALAREFSRQYAFNRTQPKRIDALFNLKIEPKESFKDFITRFREEASEVARADKNE